MSEHLDELVNRFLAWKLPQTVCADLCATDNKYPHSRSGTNLLTETEARQMLEHVLSRSFVGTAWLIELDDPVEITLRQASLAIRAALLSIATLRVERDALRAENAELRKHAEAMFADLEEIGSGLTIAVASAPSKSAAAYREWKEGKK
jgi:hypothetical protein